MAGSSLFSQLDFDPLQEDYRYGLDEEPQSPRRFQWLGNLRRTISRSARTVINAIPGISLAPHKPSEAEQALIDELRDIM